MRKYEGRVGSSVVFGWFDRLEAIGWLFGRVFCAGAEQRA